MLKTPENVTMRGLPPSTSITRCLFFLRFGTIVALIVSISLQFGTENRKSNEVDSRAGRRVQVTKVPSSTITVSEKERRAARMSLKASEEMRETGMLTAKPGLNFTLINNEGQITDDALGRAGIDSNRRQEVKATVDRLWEDMSLEIGKRLVMDANSSEPEHGISVYKISADRAFADHRLNRFKEELKSNFGKSEGQILFDGLGNINHFGWFGKLDLNIRFTDFDQTDPGFIKKVEFTGRDPKSGRTIVAGKFTQNGNELRNYFGSVFDPIDRK